MDTTPKRILVIEDDRFLRRACETALAQRGYAVAVAEDGARGLERALAEPFDLVLLDLLMPRLSGLEVLTALRAHEATRALPVLVVSNSSHRQYMDEVSRLGAEYVVKANLSLRALAERIATILGAGVGVGGGA
jgi:DNA-binding response OmpR family regulator